MDAALIALHRSQHVTATLNGVPVVAGQLDQNKIPKTEFRIEKITLSVGDRLAIRKLYQALDLNCKAGEESAKAPEFLRTLLTLANDAGGHEPLPARPTTVEIEDIQKLVGNDQLVALKNKAADFDGQHREVGQDQTTHRPAQSGLAELWNVWLGTLKVSRMRADSLAQVGGHSLRAAAAGLIRSGQLRSA